ncbi:MAG: thioredoxin [Nanobdellota archaeon]
MAVVKVGKDNFDKEVKQSDLPVVVDFWAEWCGPCKEMGPVFEEISSDYEGKLKFAKVNVEENQQIASDVGIMGIPCLIIFNEGEEVDRITGFSPKDVLKKKIDEILNKI